MGAGKTTIGRQLARRLEREFFDSDREIERSAGVDIPTIFEFEGEPGFRERESRALRKLAAHERIVMATGGGAVLAPENRALLARSGRVVYLVTGVDEQLRRTDRDRNRPLLQTDQPRLALEALAAERNPLYRGLADIEVCTERRNVRSVVNQLLKELRALRVQ